ncbi:MAG: molybdenum cofactor biosynthesis protein MoaE [Saprospiraceae bacterium]|jgi:molybdopterin synthase catalytic subunit|nr:molybdenum cofactor biosynthesis protein MoaE [Saprospiraceae bacterium]MDP4999860.1 molybdenum cofactor biosynthesis protein MoaE [Saprospiraceae bacterium]
MMIEIQLLDRELDPKYCTECVYTPEAGGIAVFVGTVRNQTADKRVLRLEFEAYEKMALSEMRKIAERAAEQWPVKRIVIHHRTGVLYAGDIAVIIAVSTPHRKAAFEACAFAIDTLKETVPIWKKEIFEDGEVWVAAHP